MNFLLAALSIKEEEIFCSSNPDQGLNYRFTGVPDQLKEKLKNSEALIVLITADSLHSAWIPFEVGTFWTTDKPVIPILGPGLIHDDLPGPLRSLLSISIEAKDWSDKVNNAINQLVEQLKSQQKVTKRRNDTLEEFSDALRAWRPAPAPQQEIEQLKAQIQELEQTRQDKEKLEQSLQSEIKQLEQQLEQERSQVEQLQLSERSHKQQLEEKERSLQLEIKKLEQQLSEARSHSQELEKLEAASRQEKEELEQNYQNQKQKLEQNIQLYQSQIRELEQQLEQARSLSSKQQADFQRQQKEIGSKESIITQLKEHIEQLKSSQKTTVTVEVELKSSKGIDYTKLRDLLKQKKWKEADEETARLMLEAAGKKSTEYLRECL